MSANLINLDLSKGVVRVVSKNKDKNEPLRHNFIVAFALTIFALFLIAESMV